MSTVLLLHAGIADSRMWEPQAEALRSAKLDMLRNSLTSAPRYWAPFILIGEADKPIPLSGSPRWLRGRLLLWIGAPLLLASVIAFFLARRSKTTTEFEAKTG